MRSFESIETVIKIFYMLPAQVDCCFISERFLVKPTERWVAPVASAGDRIAKIVHVHSNSFSECHRRFIEVDGLW